MVSDKSPVLAYIVALRMRRVAVPSSTVVGASASRLSVAKPMTTLRVKPKTQRMA